VNTAEHHDDKLEQESFWTVAPMWILIADLERACCYHVIMQGKSSIQLLCW